MYAKVINDPQGDALLPAPGEICQRVSLLLNSKELKRCLHLEISRCIAGLDATVISMALLITIGCGLYWQRLRLYMSFAQRSPDKTHPTDDDLLAELIVTTAEPAPTAPITPPPAVPTAPIPTIPAIPTPVHVSPTPPPPPPEPDYESEPHFPDDLPPHFQK